jgi:hypothetical protein
MRHLACLASSVLLLAASAFAGEVDVRGTAAGRVSVRVTAAPLSDVLDRLARQTGMKVVYDGAPPRALVRGRQVENVTVADAVADVLEGLGVSYALRLDATGLKVDTLLVLGAVRSSSSSSSSSSPVPRSVVPPVRLPGFGNVPAPPPDEDADDEPSERAEEPSLDQRSGHGEDRERRPGPPMTMPMIPTFPIGPIGPLTMPTPAPAPSPQPTPPAQ